MPNFESLNLDEQPLDPQQLLRLRGPRPQSQGGLGVIEKTLSNPDFWSTQPSKPTNVSSPVKPDPKTGQGPASSVAGDPNSGAPEHSQAPRSSGAGDEPTPSIPAGSGPSDQGGLGSMDLLGQGRESRGGEEPVRQPSLPPPGGGGTGTETQKDPVTGKPVGDEEASLQKQLDEMDKVDPVAQAKSDMYTQPQEANVGAMGYLGPLLAGILGGPYAFEGAAGGIAGAVKSRHGEVVDYNKELTRLTAEYRKSKDVNVRAALADKIKILHERNVSKIAQSRQNGIERHQQEIERNNRTNNHLRELGISESASVKRESLAVTTAYREAQEAYMAGNLDLAKIKEADYNRHLLAMETARNEDIRIKGEELKIKEATLALQQKKFDATTTEAKLRDANTHIDRIQAQIDNLELSKLFAASKGMTDQVTALDTMITNLQKDKKVVTDFINSVNTYKPAEGNLATAPLPSIKGPNGVTYDASKYPGQRMKYDNKYRISDGKVWTIDPNQKD